MRRFFAYFYNCSPDNSLSMKMWTNHDFAESRTNFVILRSKLIELLTYA